MPFDLSSAKPVEDSGGFDLSTAKPIDSEQPEKKKEKPSIPANETYGQRVERTGKAVDQAAGSGIAGTARAAVGAAENAASMFSGVAGDIAGLGTSLVTQDPKKGEAVKRALTYEPRTETGKAGQEYVGALLKPATDLLEAPRKYLEGHGHPIAAQGYQTALDVAPMKGAGKAASAIEKGASKFGEVAKENIPQSVKTTAEKIAQSGEEKAAIKAAEEAPKAEKIKQARSIGLKVPPSEGGGAVGKMLEGAGGKIQTEMDFSRANAKVINKTVGKEIGLSEKQPLTEANIERLKQKAYVPYERVRNAGRIEFDDQYRQELNAVRERTEQSHQDFPEDINADIEKEIGKFDRPSADAGSILEKVKSLRQRASRNMKSPDAEKFELGIAQKKIATAMENVIERQVPDKSLVSDFRAARQQLAKIYNVEDALGPNGNVSAAVLARQMKRGVPLSGGLKTIAETYQEFPKVMRYTDSLGGHAPFSALDYLVGGVEMSANPAKAGAIAGALAGRPIARSIIKSEAYQKRGIKAPEQKPSAISRAARKVAGNTVGDIGDETKPSTVEDAPTYTSKPIEKRKKKPAEAEQ